MLACLWLCTVVASASPEAPGQPPAASAPPAEVETTPAGSPTSAGPDNVDVARARAHFDAGNAHYAAARYQEAIHEFQAGYALVPRPSFLVNLGQAYRKIGDLDRAKESYVAYLRSLPQDSPLRDQALRVLAEIEVQRQAGGAAPEPPPTAPSPPPPDLRTTAPLPAAPDHRVGRLVGLGLVGVGVGLAATGLGFELRAQRLSDELSESDRQQGVYDPAKDRAGRRDETIGVILLAAGGVASVSGLGLYLLLAHGNGGQVALAPTVGPGGRGLALKGSF